MIHGLFIEAGRWDSANGGLSDSLPGELVPRLPAVWIKPCTEVKIAKRYEVNQIKPNTSFCVINIYFTSIYVSRSLRCTKLRSELEFYQRPAIRLTLYSQCSSSQSGPPTFGYCAVLRSLRLLRNNMFRDGRRTHIQSLRADIICDDADCTQL